MAQLAFIPPALERSIIARSRGPTPARTSQQLAAWASSGLHGKAFLPSLNDRRCRCAHGGAEALTLPSGVCPSSTSITFSTVKRIKTLEDMHLLLQANKLVTAVFHSKHSTNPALNRISYTLYLLQAACRALQLHSQASGRHLTLLATASQQSPRAAHQSPVPAAADPSSFANFFHGTGHRALATGSSRRMAAAFTTAAAAGGTTSVRSKRPRSSRPAGDESAAEEEQDAVGVVNISIRSATKEVAEALELEEGAAIAMISNMAVAESFRRQGLAQQLMKGCIDAAVRELRPRPQQLVLLVYKDYEPAMRLYRSLGFCPTSWMDPLWLADAEKGRVRQRRRLLLSRPLCL